jgi:hypothetical protein
MITRRAYIRRSPLVRKPRRYRKIGLKFKWYRDPEYLAVKAYWNFIAGEPCCVCKARGIPQTTRTEVAHVGLRGIGQKCSHWEVLCARCRKQISPEDQLPYLQNLWVGWMSDFTGQNIYRRNLVSGEWTFEQVYKMLAESFESYEMIKAVLVERTPFDEGTVSGEAKT